MFSTSFKEFSFVLMIIPNLPEGWLRNVTSKWTWMRCSLSLCHILQSSEFKLIIYCIVDLVFKLLTFFSYNNLFLPSQPDPKVQYLYNQLSGAFRVILLHSACLNLPTLLFMVLGTSREIRVKNHQHNIQRYIMAYISCFTYFTWSWL